MSKLKICSSNLYKKKNPQKQLKENELKIWAKIYRVPVGPFA